MPVLMLTKEVNSMATAKVKKEMEPYQLLGKTIFLLELVKKMKIVTKQERKHIDELIDLLIQKQGVLREELEKEAKEDVGTRSNIDKEKSDTSVLK